MVPVVALAAVLSLAALLLHVRERLPGDEGYLWYGALRTLDGEVPLRDFRSYEPGRYYWCASWMLALGRGIVALRVAVHAFYFIGLSCALVALRLAGVGWPAVLVAAVLLTAWAYPPYKLFEPALAMIAVLAGTVLLTDPGLGAAFAAGAVAGGIAFFGVNYALYAGAALFVLGLLTGAKSGELDLLPGLTAYLAGAAVGAAPLLAMFGLVKGMFAAFFDRRVRAILARGTSNLPLPVPWPWRAPTSATRKRGPVARWFVGLYFLLLPAFGWSVLTWAALSPWDDLRDHAAVVAAGVVCAFAAHHAFSRADLTHLAQSMPPFILGAVALLGHGAGWAALAVLLGAGTVATVVAVHPRLKRHRRPDDYVRRDIRGSSVWMTRGTYRLLDTLCSAVDRHLGATEPLCALPTLAVLHPVLDRRSAVYDTFCVYPATESEQRAMLRSIEEQRVRLVVVRDHPLDGREDLRFSRTHPAVWSHLRSEFEALHFPDLPSGFHLLYRS